MNRYALHQLILDLFEGTSQFRNFLLYEDRAPDLIHALPAVSVAAETFVSDAITSLEVRGLIDSEFFRRLVVARPGRLEEIARTALQWHVSLAEPPRRPEPPAPPVRRPAPEVGLPPPAQVLHLEPREAVTLDQYGVRSGDAGSLALSLMNGADADAQTIAFTSTVGHIQQIPSVGRGGRSLAIARHEALGVVRDLSWGEYDIRVSADAPHSWRIGVQSRRRRFTCNFHVLSRPRDEREELA